MSVLVVGTVAFDSIETPFGSAERILGGAASYFSLARALSRGHQRAGPPRAASKRSVRLRAAAAGALPRRGVRFLGQYRSPHADRSLEPDPPHEAGGLRYHGSLDPGKPGRSSKSAQAD